MRLRDRDAALRCVHVSVLNRASVASRRVVAFYMKIFIVLVFVVIPIFRYVMS